MGSGWIEIAQHDDAPLWFRSRQIAQCVFDCELCATVGIGGVQWEVFTDWQ